MGSVPPPRCRWLCPRGSPVVQSGMKAGCNPSCKVLTSFSSSSHGWETWREVWPLLQPQYRVGCVCLGQSVCPFLDLEFFQAPWQFAACQSVEGEDSLKHAKVLCNNSSQIYQSPKQLSNQEYVHL